MVPEAEYRKVEEHEPVHPRLWAEMSPPPTRMGAALTYARRYVYLAVVLDWATRRVL